MIQNTKIAMPSQVKSLWSYLFSAKGKSQFHALVTAALAVYTALRGAGVL